MRATSGWRSTSTDVKRVVAMPRGTESGLIEAERVLRRVRGIAPTRFTSVDVLRHPLVARIVEAYDAARTVVV